MHFETIEAYEFVKEQELIDINSKGYILRHKKSGARIALISNDDDNKVFYIGFKTPPTDETGAPHIIEHSVLCGSEKFPVKEPFVELVKGSLNTFLNAMTYPDKTVYPIASCNDQDFKNLMDVYLDAVFHPNILKCEEIFKQEGWHYELEDLDAPITINGVVYNEMKGAYSSPDEMLQTLIYKSLFPDNTYGKDSGGNPAYIPELTYEAYLDFYKKYYHPSNSYIFLYGDCDMEERLEWLDKAYLSEFDEIEVISQIEPQNPFGAVKDITGKYPIGNDESEEDNTYLSYSKVVCDISDKTLRQAFSVLDYVLISAPGAPVRQALIDAGIGQDVYGSFDDGTLQTTFHVCAKNANASDWERFVENIENTLKQIVAEGINKRSVLAAINSSQFRFREADFGSYPKGLLYGLDCLDTWIFDNESVFDSVEMLSVFEFLKKQIDTGYYEELIQKYLLDNTHGVVVSLEPEKGLNTRVEKALEQKLAEYKEQLSEEELKKLVEETRRLEEYQEAPSKEEDLKKIPMLKRKDMKKQVMPFSNMEETIGDVPVVRHEVFTNGIDYISFLFDAGDVDKEDLPVLGLLRSVLAFVDTENYSYSELNDVINIYSGGISSGLNICADSKVAGKLHMKYEFRIKMLEEDLEKSLEILQEIILASKVEDVKRLTEIIAQTKSRLQSVLSSAGHVVSATRSLAYFSQYGYIQDATTGIAFYDEICKMDMQMKKEPELVIGRLQKIINQIFCQERLLISFTAEEESYKKSVPVLQRFIEALPKGVEASEMPAYTLGKQNEAFTDASAIQYVSRSGNFVKNGFAYTGALNILKMILSYDYLWNNVRVKGGAYGCSSSFLRTGDSYFTSYRDPNLGKTNEVYEKVPDYIRNFQADEREMTKYIIGTLGNMDIPLYPEGKGHRSMTAYLKKLTLEELQAERDEILNATDADIRKLADLVEAVLSDACICVIGNENNIQKEKELFRNIRRLNE
ncbi:MAG: insulinase family protein [Agathobacter sp.]|nr:insulinase family protein [Agathobacter sp.]